MSNGIVFQVETDRVLQILAKEIYDSPLALLRENVQNAYDAVRMRFAKEGALQEGGRIDVNIASGEVRISDNGIGMSEEVLRENFWKAGSSGKRSTEARKAGVVGTFGIGAMANFGVSRKLTVETRTEGSEHLLRSVAERDSLKIAEECISFERTESDRPVGTTVSVLLDSSSPISLSKAKEYLLGYVRLLPVPVYLNGELISLQQAESLLRTGGRTFETIGTHSAKDNVFAAKCEIRVDPNGQVLAFVSDIRFAGSPVEGSLALLQGGGQLMGLRSFFGLAPIPAAGTYQFGGFANLPILQPTAGREALSRESIDHVSRLVKIAEFSASTLISKTDFADRNTAFLQWVTNNNKWEFADRVKVHALPEDEDVRLGNVKAYLGKKPAQYYLGADTHILNTFASEGACLFQVAQSNPRRSVQLHYLSQILGIKQIPDSVQVTRIYESSELTAAEASVLLRIAAILRDDYLLADVDISLVEMSHNVAVLSEKHGEEVQLRISRSAPLLTPLIEFRDKAFGVFGAFMKDFVRVHIYPRIKDYVPTSTRGGVDALRKTLERNRELYRYEEAERGDLEGMLGEYLSGEATLTEVLKTVRSGGGGWGWGQSQRVSSEQVGTVESVVPEVAESPISSEGQEGAEFAASPPIMREDITSDMKILTASEEYPQLNRFTTFLGLSDRLMRTEAEFFRMPHTTRVIWGGHRVIYIFTEMTGKLSLYYDIELRDPIEQTKAGGGFFPTTTLVTKTRVFIPIPPALRDEFTIVSGSREFFVRFDLLSSDSV